jgi:hypothetical protein
MARMEIFSGVERRRRWSKEAKLAILAEADQPGVRIGDALATLVRPGKEPDAMTIPPCDVVR